VTIRRNDDAERAILGGVIVHPQSLALVRARIGSDDFYAPAHATTWEAIVALADDREPIDAVTIANRLQTMGRANTVHTLLDIEQLRFYAAKRWEHVEAHAKVIAELSMARRVETACERSLRDASVCEVADDAVERLFQPGIVGVDDELPSTVVAKHRKHCADGPAWRSVR
jgi:replicative DNA helicase